MRRTSSPSDDAVQRGGVQVERVPQRPGRVRRRQVQRLEVEPVGLDLGPVGDGEAHAAEHVLEALPGLGDDVGVADPGMPERLGQVETLGLRDVRSGPATPARRVGSATAASSRSRASLSAAPKLRRSSGSMSRIAALSPLSSDRLPSSSASSSRNESEFAGRRRSGRCRRRPAPSRCCGELRCSSRRTPVLRRRAPRRGPPGRRPDRHCGPPRWWRPPLRSGVWTAGRTAAPLTRCLEGHHGAGDRDVERLDRHRPSGC